MKKVLLYIWQLPQNLLGLLVIKYTKATRASNRFWLTRHYIFGVSLGKYIIIGPIYPGKMILDHEQGHQKQSIILGPLYLLVIGLPSVTGNLLHRIFNFDYYKQPWEAWADKLGGVNR
jgi:hypothetical protein